ncbi:FtsX-like permease family protein [Variovorax dokdonensis]|uniref:FtsX-like permease family protein n=1 Tax=Variovorax dokdonensis TaxID=344883 RepID=A0ABT7NEM2_9BURK|nr:ABC transporter permease [Variovorax dokdonensis]MDM0046399.1 FtsX-like permease family protein [Variovorax dokdonensis]
MLALLRTFSWRELRHHPWRSSAAVIAVMLGVALAFSVQLINASALEEFSSAVRSVNGQPDLELRAAQGSFDERVFPLVAGAPQVALASPVLEAQVQWLQADGSRAGLRVIGVDALVLPTLAPSLMPVPAPDADRLAVLSPNQAFLNPAAQELAGPQAQRIRIEIGGEARTLQVAGHVAAGGSPLAVMDIGAAQDLLARQGRLSRIDLRLRPGADRAALVRELEQSPAWPSGIRVAEPGDAAARVSNLSRAYRVNLTVLALVALFTGAFLVFSVLSLSVAKRAQQFALLGVLGLTPRERLRLVMLESGVLGLIGSLAGLAFGTGLAAAALRLLGGDLGGGYFPGVQPTLRFSPVAAAAYGLLGLLAALVGGWWPARAAQVMPEAQTLKGLGATQAASGSRRSRWLGIGLMLAGGVLALAPPVFGVPVAAYLAVGLLLVGGIATLPLLIQALYDRLAPWLEPHLLPMLALERARRMRGTAAVAVSGVVASLSLAVALTVMVASFRDSVAHWLDAVLPAQLYLRGAGSGASTAGALDAAAFDPAFVQAVGALPGVARTATLRTRSLLLDSTRPPVTLIARSISGDAASELPLVGELKPVPAGAVAIYVSEAMVDLYGARPGQVFEPLARVFEMPQGQRAPSFFVAGVWRDYVRQFGAITLSARDFETLTGERAVSDVAIWLREGASEEAVQSSLRELAARRLGSAEAVEINAAGAIRANSLRIFDRSFAVTYWLQAVAIGIGLFGIAASFSAQVLARRREFGLLTHLGFTRGQVLAVVAGEGAAWTAVGALAGLALGLAVSLVLVHVVNPQSFHWTMDLAVPWLRLALLCAAVMVAGTLTAWLSGRAAAGRDAVLAVKEDW